MSYFKDGWAGSHDFKVGYDWKRDRRFFTRPQPGGDIFYRDLNGAVNELELYNSPNTSTNTWSTTPAHISDSWKLNERLTLNLGIRFEAYSDGFPDQSFTPNGHAALINWPADVNPAERARYQSFIAPVTVQAREVANTFNVAPRAGFAYDLTGDNRTVVKGYYGRFYFNSADTLADLENPVGSARLRYRWNDLERQPPAERPAGDSARSTPCRAAPASSTSTTTSSGPTRRSSPATSSARSSPACPAAVSYVYKQVRDEWVEIDPNRAAVVHHPVLVRRHRRRRRARHGRRPDAEPAGSPGQRAAEPLLHQPDRPGLQQRLPDRGVRHQPPLRRPLDAAHLVRLHLAGPVPRHHHEHRRPRRAVAGQDLSTGASNQRLYGDNGKETSTLWNYKVIGRYTMPWEIGFSGSWKVQSGRQYGRNTPVAFPGDGTQSIRMEEVTANRAPTVSILDLRADKSFTFGRFGRLTGMVDVFNLMNNGTVVNFATTTGTTNYERVLGILDPRIVRFGVRYDF